MINVAMVDLSSLTPAGRPLLTSRGPQGFRMRNPLEEEERREGDFPCRDGRRNSRMF